MVHVLSRDFIGKRVSQIPKFGQALGVYVLCASICYIILIILLDSFIVPVFIDDFNRSIMFLTAIIAVIYYKEDLKEILLICFGGPLIVNILAIIPAIYIWSGSPSDQVWTDLMRLFTFSSLYIVYAGFAGILIYSLAVWISGFLSSRSPVHSSAFKKNVFTFIDKKDQNDYTISVKEYSNNKAHTTYQLIGFLLYLSVLFCLTILLFLVPIYNYSFDLHLSIWDLGLIPVLLVGLAAINLLSIVIFSPFWHYYPSLTERYPNLILNIQSNLSVICIFFASIFFPNPSNIRVGTFVVENGIGIEILFYLIILIIIFTPAIYEYVQPLRNLKYHTKQHEPATPSESQ
ncbi:MAG: hypothetical protein ACFFB2_18630 [Promethearchaeota archaeon]